jgi:hypothetical protein
MQRRNCAINSWLCVAWGYLLTLLVLALRHHRLGWKGVWQTSATTPPAKRRPSQKVPNRSGSLPAPVTARMVANINGHRPRQIMHPPNGDTARRETPRRPPRHKDSRGKTYVVYVPDVSRPPVSHPRTHRRATSPARGR